MKILRHTNRHFQEIPRMYQNFCFDADFSTSTAVLSNFVEKIGRIDDVGRLADAQTPYTHAKLTLLTQTPTLSYWIDKLSAYRLISVCQEVGITWKFSKPTPRRHYRRYTSLQEVHRWRHPQSLLDRCQLRRSWSSPNRSLRCPELIHRA